MTDFGYEIEVTSGYDRENLTVEIYARQHQIAEIRHEPNDAEPIIGLFSYPDFPLEFPLAVFVEMLTAAIETFNGLDDPSTRPPVDIARLLKEERGGD